MKKSFCVGIGGAAGTLVRYALFQVPLPGGSVFRPLMTMLINISGSFILGFLIILFAKRFPVRAEIRLAVTAGFLGGYTTFSTMCKDTVTLFYSGKVLLAASYISVSVLLGLTAAWWGIRAGKHLERRRAS